MRHQGVLGAMLALCSTGAAFGGSVALQNATATFSQLYLGQFYPAAEAIDGLISGVENGWAIYDPSSDSTSPQTAVWETAADLSAPTLEVWMRQNHGASHMLGRFRLSVTTDDRETFADGLQSGGDVDAAWTVLTPQCVFAPAGLTAAVLGDGSVLMSGAAPATGDYVLRLPLALSGVTGVRLEAMADPSLPTAGPGLQPGNGNFVLSEIEVYTIPVKTGCAEDIDHDGDVDFGDLNQLLGNFNSTGACLQGDFDQDGDADFADLNQLLGAFNTAC